MGTARRMLGVAVAGLLVAGCGGGEALRAQDNDVAAEDDSGELAPVKIGLLVPTSGVYTTLGNDLKQGFELYLDQNGGQLGGRDVKIVTADEGNGADTGVPSGQRLVNRDNVDIITGIVASPTAVGVRDLVHEAEVPLVIANAGFNALTGKDGSPFVWRTSFANRDDNFAFGQWLATQPEIPGGVFLLGSDYNAGHEQIGGFRDAFTAGGGTIAGEIFTPFGTTTDFQPFLARARDSGAGAVYAFYAGQEAVTFVRQYAEFGLAGEIPLFSSGNLTEGPALEAQGDAALGIKTVFHYSSELDTPVNRKFVTAYREVYDQIPSTFAVQAYDAAYVLDEAIGRLDGRITGKRLVAALGRIGTIDSPRGEWRFSDGHNPDQNYYLREVREVDGVLVNAVLEDLGPIDLESPDYTKSAG